MADFQTYEIVGRVKIRGTWVNVYKSEQGKLYYISEKGRNRRYLTRQQKAGMRKHKKRPYFLKYDQKEKKYPKRRRK